MASAELVASAQAGDAKAFEELVGGHRRELLAHCYRMLGSLQDAEDVLQESLLAAWQGLGGFEGRSSLRTWLYRISTNRCLNALRSRRSSPPTAGVGSAQVPEPTRMGEVWWIEPYPDPLGGELAEPRSCPTGRRCCR